MLIKLSENLSLYVFITQVLGFKFPFKNLNTPIVCVEKMSDRSFFRHEKLDENMQVAKFIFLNCNVFHFYQAFFNQRF
jgi:hypothetical protein